jgi:hypothetical protein
MLGEVDLAQLSTAQEPQDAVSREGRAVAERHGEVLTASDGGRRFENVLVIQSSVIG